MSEVIDPRWSEALALDRRRAPEFYAAGNEVPAASTHAEAIRFALDELGLRSEEHTSELQSLMRTSYVDFCLKKKEIEDHQQSRQRVRTRMTPSDSSKQ